MRDFLLRELDAEFLVYNTKVEDVQMMDGKFRKSFVEYHHIVTKFAEAQGVTFQCAHCAKEKGFKPGDDIRGVHYVEVTFKDRRVADNQGTHARGGRPSRWEVSGTGIGDLTVEPSIDISTTCGWHGYITRGKVTDVK